jgi:enterochelin esterase family protein
MKRLSIYILTTLLIAVGLKGQQSPGEGRELISPEVHDNNTVTFRIFDPGANEVKISGDWMPAEGWMPGSVKMVREERGIWTYTSQYLEPELYTYTVLIDGFSTIDPNNVFIVRDIGSIMNIFIIGGGKGDLYSVNDVAHGSVTRRWYDSPSLGRDRRIAVYTPPGYENNNKEYPVLYLLHGAGGDEEAWITLGRAAQIMDNLVARGEAEPMIVVMPNGNVIQEAAPGEGSSGFYKPRFMVPNTMDGQYEASFPDIMSFVEDNYRVKTGKANRAIAGLSMGGFHALHISRYYPGMFDYVGLFSAAILPDQDVSHEVYKDIDGTLIRQKENGYQLYWIGMGKTDFLYQPGVAYRDKLDSLGLEYLYRETEGGHVWKNWRVYLTEFASLLFK